MLPKNPDSFDVIDAIISDAAELDAADPRNITDEDRAWADGMRARMKVRIAEYRRSLLPATDAPTIGKPIRPSFLAMTRDQVMARIDEIGRRMGGQVQVAHRKLSELDDDDLRRLLQTLESEENEP